MPATAHSIAVVAEKPAVARDIARVLGASQRGDGFLQGNGYVVTWAIGHLVTLPQPHEVNPEWRKWRRDHLPMLPRDWPLVLSVGRVQTPTLAMLVERELAIRAFVPEDYLEVLATFSPESSRGAQEESRPGYKGTWFRGFFPNPEAKRIKTAADGKPGSDLEE